jgi:hypothetical protein
MFVYSYYCECNSSIAFVIFKLFVFFLHVSVISNLKVCNPKQFELELPDGIGCLIVKEPQVCACPCSDVVTT